MDAFDAPTRWYEREPWDEVRDAEARSERCFDRTVRCSAANPCNSDQRCVGSWKFPSRETCVRLAKEGEPCDGPVGDICRDDLECWSDDPLAQGGVCDEPSCASPPPTGTCRKPPATKK
jgi:hypothetical protein